MRMVGGIKIETNIGDLDGMGDIRHSAAFICTLKPVSESKPPYQQLGELASS